LHNLEVIEDEAEKLIEELKEVADFSRKLIERKSLTYKMRN
jgi:hypothetical protein